MFFGVLLGINTWNLVKGVSINAYWAIRLIPWPILLYLLALIALWVVRLYLVRRRQRIAARQYQLSEETKMELLRKIEENTRPKT